MFPVAFFGNAKEKLASLANLMGKDAVDIRRLLEELDDLQKFLSVCGQQIELHPFLYGEPIVRLEQKILDLEDSAEALHRHQTMVQKSILLVTFRKTVGTLLVQAQARKATDLAESIFGLFFGPKGRSSSGYAKFLSVSHQNTQINFSSIDSSHVAKRRETYILEGVLDGYRDKRKYLEAISIVGNRGTGKTALAQHVYDRWKQQQRLGSWAVVSRTSSLRSIGEDILQSWQQQGTSQNTDEEIMQRVRDFIGGRRWLLVLDGVEKENEDLVRELLKEFESASGPRSKLLITTRSSQISFSDLILRGLSKTEAWELMKSAASNGDPEGAANGTEEIGMEIAIHVCKSVPLAIKLVGCLLHSGEWRSIKENGLLKPSHEFPDVEDLEFRQSILDPLPANVQLCFSYCGLLPKGHDIDLDKLIAMWMAQGFIDSSSSERAEGTGYVYFSKLRDSKLFNADDVKKDEWGRDRWCRMRDLENDLALYVSSNRVILMDPQGEAVDTRRAHHIALDFNLDSSWQVPRSLLKSQGLRTILLSPQSRLPREVKLSTSTCHAIFSSFKKLRVLDLHDLGMMTVPDSLGRLKHIRYLDLSSNSFVTLPRCTTSLFYLQTLKLSNCHKLKELPVGFKNLVNLRHLHIDGCFALTHMPLGLGSMNSLQTLSTFVVSEIRNSAKLEQLKSLNDLSGNLEILHLERAKCDAPEDQNPILGNKEKLKCLTLRWNRDFDDEEVKSDKGDDERLLKILKPHRNLKGLFIMGFKGKFPDDYFTVPLNLVKISLYHCPVIQFLPRLHQLSSLKVLELQRLEAMESVADPSARESTEPFFPSLKEVTIWDCPRLTSWWKSGAPLPDVCPSKGIEKLEIRYCPELKTFPFHPENLILVCSSKYQLEQIMKEMSGCHSSSDSDASSSDEEGPSFSHSDASSSFLKSLTIGRIEDLDSLSETRLKSFNSLQALHIHDCHKLTSLLKGIQHLSSLEYLNVENCVELNLGYDNVDGSQWNGLVELHTLIIKGIPKLEALPLGLQQAKSLQELQLHSCPKLMSLPKWIGQRTSLQTIIIEDCPKLMPRIQKETGEDWPLVAKRLKQ